MCHTIGEVSQFKNLLIGQLPGFGQFAGYGLLCGLSEITWGSVPGLLKLGLDVFAGFFAGYAIVPSMVELVTFQQYPSASDRVLYTPMGGQDPLQLGLLDVGDVLSILKQQPNHVEVIITRRSPYPDLVAIAELHSEHNPHFLTSSPKEKPITGLHLTIGPGKGKSTTALGHALRSVGRAFAGTDTRAVKIIQFLKGGAFGSYTEDAALAALQDIGPGLVEHERYGRPVIIFKRLPAGVDPSQLRQPIDFAYALSAFYSGLEAIKSGKYQMVILDEILPVFDLDLLPDGPQQLLEALENKSPTTAVHLTGRCWEENPQTQKLLNACDSCTYIEGHKHYFNNDRDSRAPGIDL
jgi:cob(I)alamin adenosyltransferase